MILFVMFSLLTGLSTELQNGTREPPPPEVVKLKTKPPPQPISCYKCAIRSTETEIKVHDSKKELLLGFGTVYNSSLHSNIIELCPKMDCFYSCALVTGEATITDSSVAFPTQLPWYATPGAGAGAGGGQTEEQKVNLEYRTCASPAFDMCSSFPELDNEKCRQQVCQGDLCNAAFLKERKNLLVIILAVVVSLLVVFVVIGLILLWLYKKRQRNYMEIEQEQQRMVRPRVGLFRRVLITVGMSEEPDLVPAPPDGTSPDKGKEGWFSNWMRTAGKSSANANDPAPQPEIPEVEQGWFGKLKKSGSVRWGRKGHVKEEVEKIEVVTTAPHEHTEKKRVKSVDFKKDSGTEENVVVEEEKRTVKSFFKFKKDSGTEEKIEVDTTAPRENTEKKMVKSVGVKKYSGTEENYIVEEEKRTVKSFFKFKKDSGTEEHVIVEEEKRTIKSSSKFSHQVQSVFKSNKRESATEDSAEPQATGSEKPKKSSEPDDEQVTISIKKEQKSKVFWKI